jgi:hypothetical protein
MSEFSSGDLSTSAPLIAREKVKDGTHKVLCGVRDCPETFGHRDHWSVVIAPGYELGKDRTLIKSRRSGARQIGHREYVFEQVKPRYEDALYDNRKEFADSKYANGAQHSALSDPSATERDYIAATNAANYRKWYRQAERARDAGAGPSLEWDCLPILIRCARCGRLSKIEPAQQRR